MFSLIIYILIAAIGFMMGFLYKKSYTSAQFFEFNLKKLLRIFMVVFVVAILTTFALSWFTMHALSDSTIPDDSVMKYNDTKSVMLFLLNLFFLVLVILSNFYSQALKKIAPVPYLLALGFYILFILKDAYYISWHFTEWQKALAMLQQDFTADFHRTGLMKCALALLVTSFNAIMVWWGMRK